MSKRALYYIDNHKIEVVHTFFGKEKILLNGRTVSKKVFEVGVEHLFTIGENRYRIAQRDISYGEKLNRFEIRKNGSPISLVNRLSRKPSHQMFIMVVLCGLGTGFILGVVLYKMLWPTSGV
ncbi:hypothetical protein [Zobellia uliginosa]|uniref:hypothetical protein n=1 Tax=Zobellia uliginosa TaxID=143224 RepID=UPI0026E1E1C4|nr:hypothetical protein [Zobellia uliginosa]MDO6517562.1 hypothetical protein [Zobellia uliginosa]